MPPPASSRIWSRPNVSTTYFRDVIDWVFHSLFKNKVENATHRFHSHDERDWPSFLYPPGCEYNVNEMDKDLFRGPIVIRVRYILSCAVIHAVKLFTDVTNDLYGQRFFLYWPSFCPQTFPSRNAQDAWGFSRGCRLRCCLGEFREVQPF